MSTTTTKNSSLRVYFSYSWRNPKIKRKALWLADKLRANKIDSRIDLFYGRCFHGFTPPPPRPDQDAWDYWQEEQIKLADRIIIFCAEEYAFAPSGSGAARDLRYIKSDLKTSRDGLRKLIPVGLGSYEANASFIPSFISGATYYDIGSPQRGEFGLGDLIRRLKTEFPAAATQVEENSPAPKRKGANAMTKSLLQPSDLKGRIHAAIITIRQDEYEAMEAKLGKLQTVIGNNAYKYAQIKPADRPSISVVLTRVVGQGNTKAQAVASNIIYELDPAWLILVGIAGGVPDTEYSLGDVVLATYLHDFSLTAATDDGVTRQSMGGDMHRDVVRFLSTRAVGADGKRLSELAGFDTDSELLDHPVVYSTDVADSKRYYGPPSYRKKVERSIEARFPNGKRNGGPLIRQGPCANGNVLVKSVGLLEEWQKSARHIVQVEMELAGVYEAAKTAGRENYPVLAIRGLSDIVGFARDAHWTGYACKTAAAFASAVLRSGFIDFEKNLPQETENRPLSVGATRQPINVQTEESKVSNADQRSSIKHPENRPLTVRATGQAASSPLAIWQRKLAFLQTEEAKASDAAQKFSIQQSIEEALEKIRELGG